MTNKTPPRKKRPEVVRPTTEAMRVALEKSPEIPQRAERKILPPSSGNAGMRLKSISTRLISASHSATAATVSKFERVTT
jgi:hypothetical protein